NSYFKSKYQDALDDLLNLSIDEEYLLLALILLYVKMDNISMAKAHFQAIFNQEDKYAQKIILFELIITQKLESIREVDYLYVHNDNWWLSLYETFCNYYYKFIQLIDNPQKEIALYDQIYNDDCKNTDFLKLYFQRLIKNNEFIKAYELLDKCEDESLVFFKAKAFIIIGEYNKAEELIIKLLLSDKNNENEVDLKDMIKESRYQPYLDLIKVFRNHKNITIDDELFDYFFTYSCFTSYYDNVFGIYSHLGFYEEALNIIDNMDIYKEKKSNILIQLKRFDKVIEHLKQSDLSKDFIEKLMSLLNDESIRTNKKFIDYICDNKYLTEDQVLKIKLLNLNTYIKNHEDLDMVYLKNEFHECYKLSLVNPKYKERKVIAGILSFIEKDKVLVKPNNRQEQIEDKTLHTLHDIHREIIKYGFETENLKILVDLLLTYYDNYINAKEREKESLKRAIFQSVSHTLNNILVAQNVTLQNTVKNPESNIKKLLMYNEIIASIMKSIQLAFSDLAVTKSKIEVFENESSNRISLYDILWFCFSLNFNQLLSGKGYWEDIMFSLFDINKYPENIDIVEEMFASFEVNEMNHKQLLDLSETFSHYQDIEQLRNFKFHFDALKAFYVDKDSYSFSLFFIIFLELSKNMLKYGILNTETNRALIIEADSSDIDVNIRFSNTFNNSYLLRSNTLQGLNMVKLYVETIGQFSQQTIKTEFDSISMFEVKLTIYRKDIIK
ncbi:MAG TPA: hypothetical protein PK816_04250, partial [Candidatus Cloacimonadota bacterium]|nr:hypothetical protein [Candidatus Cloacimonadota bacterium]